MPKCKSFDFWSRHQDEVEIVITENYSSKLDTKKLLKLRSNIVKVYSNIQNLGFARNLFLSLTMAKGKYLMLLGDDDFVDPDLLNDLMSYLSSTTKKNLVFLPLHDLYFSEDFDVSTAFAFMRSGAMPGIVCSKEAINLSMASLDNLYFKSSWLWMFLQIWCKISLFIRSNSCWQRPSSGGKIYRQNV